MNVAILGTEQPSQIVAQIIEQHYNPWLKQRLGETLNVVAYVTWGKGGTTPNLGNIAVLNLMQFALLYRKKLIDKIILPLEVDSAQRNISIYLQELGVDTQDFYLANRLTNQINVLNFLEPYFSAKYLPYLEFHVADHCNLNCKACEHYCGLVKNPKFPDFKKFAQDFERFHEFIDDIDVIRILGGEPLLNPEINEYVRLSRRLYPRANIFVVTNAILLPKMPEDFFETLRQNNAAINISFYPPLQSKMPEIQNLLTRKQVKVVISPLVTAFTIKQTLRRHDKPQEIFLQCLQATCHNLYEGKIGACFLPFTTKYFNEYYGENLPEDGALDLYDANLTTEKLRAHLRTPFERCRYCTLPVAVPWDTVKHPSPVTDWTNDNLT